MGFERPVPYKCQFHSPRGHDTPEKMPVRKTKLKIPKGQTETVHRRRTENTKTLRTNNDIQNTTQKRKDQATRTSLNTGVNLGAPER